MKNKETIAVHSGLNSDTQYGSVTPPIFVSSNYNFIGFNNPRKHEYSRKKNPTRDITQNIISKLEGGKGSIITNTGMSAIHLICNFFLKPNDLILAPHDCYGGSYRLFDSQSKKNNYKVVFINQNNDNELKKYFLKNPKLIIIESPSNPLLNVVDIKKICRQAKKYKTISIVDNTFLSPILQNPLELGADIVVHSCTKYLNGHSDILAGAIISKNEKILNDLEWWANNIGVTGSAFDSYLLMRGLRTLPLRLKIAQNNALSIIKFLKTQPLVSKIYHPSLPENIGHQYALKQQKGFGAILSFELNINKEKYIKLFLENLKLFTLAESLGGIESLISHPATMTHSSMSEKSLEKAGISRKLLRISVGIENEKDLIDDLKKAFLKIEKKRLS